MGRRNASIWIVTVVLAIVLTFATVRLARTIDDYGLERVQAERMPVNDGGRYELERIVGLFGRDDRPPAGEPDRPFRADNVFESISLTGIVWRDDEAKSIALIRLGRDMVIARVGARLDDGTEILELGREHAVITRGSSRQILHFEFRKPGIDAATASRNTMSRDTLVLSEFRDRARNVPVIRLASGPPPEVRRRKTGIRAQEDQRLQQLQRQSEQNKKGKPDR